MARKTIETLGLVLLGLGLAGCAQAPATGAAAVELRFLDPADHGALRGLLSGVVDAIRVEVSDESGPLVQQAFAYDAMGGTVEGIPAGAGRNFLVEALAGEQVAYRGVVLGVTISAGETAEVAVELSAAYTEDVYAPAKVTDLAAAVQGEAVVLTWTATGDDGLVGRAHSYDLRWSENTIQPANFSQATPIEGTPSPAVAGDAESFTVSGLTPGETVHFALRVVDDAGNQSEVSEEVHATPESGDQSPPAAIADLAAAVVDETTVELSWTAPGDDGVSGTVGQYDVRLSDQPIDADSFDAAQGIDGPAQPVAAGETETLAVDGLTTGQTYYFAVKAADEVPNWAPISNVVEATPADVVAPAAVNLAVVAVTDTSVSLEWNAPGDDGDQGTADRYDIRYADFVIDAGSFDSAEAVAAPPAPQPAGTAQQVTVDGLDTAVEYSFALIAYDEADNASDLSNVVLATPGEQDTTPPAAVADLAVDSAAETSVLLSWTAPGDDGAGGNPVAAYDVRYSVSDIADQAAFDAATPFAWPGGTDIVAPGETQTLEVTGLDPEQQYFFALRARDEFDNWSDLSNAVSATTVDLTAPAAIADLAVDSVADTSAVLSWTAPGDDGAGGDAVSAYDVRYSTSDIVDQAAFDAATPFTWPAGTDILAAGQLQTLEVSGLDQEQQYYFAVEAVDEADNWSPLSNVPSATTVDLTAPAAIADLAVDSVADTSAVLSWTAPGDDGAGGDAVSAYDVRYSTSDIVDQAAFDAATPFTWPAGTDILAAGQLQTLEVSGLDQEQQYYFAVEAVDEADNWSPLSNVPSATTVDLTAPAAIADLGVGTVGATSVELTWTAPGDDGDTGTATSYDIRYSENAIDAGNFDSATPVASPPAPQAAGSAESFTVAGLTNGVMYYFAIKAVDEAGNTAAISDVVTATPALW